MSPISVDFGIVLVRQFMRGAHCNQTRGEHADRVGLAFLAEGLHGDRPDQAEDVLGAMLQFADQELPVFLGPLALGHVHQHAERTLRPALPVEDHLGPQLQPADGLVRPAKTELDLEICSRHS